MPTGLGDFFAGRKLGVAIVVATIATVSAGGTAAGFALSSGGPASTSAAIPPKSRTPAARALGPTTSPTTTVPTMPGATATPAVTPGASVIITDTCRYSHEANDDPILDPGKQGQSMAHDFFGNTSTSATSTAATLLGGSTTCSTTNDASAYWTPVLYQNGVPITPLHNLIYWAGLQRSSPSVVAPPVGVEMIAGNENASAPQSTKVIDWRCAGPAIQPTSNVPVNCPGTKGLELRVTFPSCWNGSTLTGASQTNVVYSEGSQCPAGYPVRIPTVVFHVVYPITTATGLTLSMGPGQQGSTDTAHGDFINGWNQSVLTALINGCAGPTRTCGHVTGADSPRRHRTHSAESLSRSLSSSGCLSRSAA
jgi:hypothetical protein